MKISSKAFAHGAVIPDQYAFARPEPEQQVALSDNLNPALEWSDIPAGCKSLVLICVDPEVPSKPDDVNQEDREVPAELPRIDFYHWVMVDIPPSVTGIEEGACSNGVTPHGKDKPPGPAGARQGVNNYTDWFAGDADMEGHYFGYDGPCPPWNDSIIHHYHFRLFATDLEHCPVDGAFGGADVLAAIDGHVLAEAEWMGTFTLNPRLR